MTSNFMEPVSCWHHLTCCVLNFMSMSPFDEPTSPYIWQHGDISIIHAFSPMMFFFSSNLTTHPPSSAPSIRCCLHLFGDDLCLLFSFHLPTLQLRCMRCEGHITRFLRLRGKGRGFNFALLPHYLSLRILDSVHLFSVFFATNTISPFNYLTLVLFWMGKNPSYMRTNESIFNSSYFIPFLHEVAACEIHLSSTWFSSLRDCSRSCVKSIAMAATIKWSRTRQVFFYISRLAWNMVEGGHWGLSTEQWRFKGTLRFKLVIIMIIITYNN